MTEPTAVCPECLGRPADPLTEQVDRCHDHQRAVDRSGSDDARVSREWVGLTEAGGESNRAWCALLHKGRDESP